MAVYVALLRGINVGGTGILTMKDLTALCGKLGFARVRTYIQSGNVVFEAEGSEEAVQEAFEEVLLTKMGKKIDVMVRTMEEMKGALEANPFPEREGNKIAVYFLKGKPPEKELGGLAGAEGEQVRVGRRVVYVYYPEGMGRSKLKLPLGGAAATVRNMNTVAKLTNMAAG